MPLAYSIHITLLMILSSSWRLFNMSLLSALLFTTPVYIGWRGKEALMKRRGLKER
jgi:hypothetical protein